VHLVNHLNLFHLVFQKHLYHLSYHQHLSHQSNLCHPCHPIFQEDLVLLYIQFLLLILVILLFQYQHHLYHLLNQGVQVDHQYILVMGVLRVQYHLYGLVPLGYLVFLFHPFLLEHHLIHCNQVAQYLVRQVHRVFLKKFKNYEQFCK
jgi:hypothetical protein